LTAFFAVFFATFLTAFFFVAIKNVWWEISE
jgi:hypothetical protein